MPEFDTPEAVRLQLLANGYTPIRNFDKRTFMKGWPSAEITEEEIRRWSRRFSRDTATGIRVEGGLAVIDIDIDDKETVEAIADAIFEAVPELADPANPLLVRTGKGAKEAWYVRTEELFSRIHSHAWCRPHETEDAGTHRIEIFGGASPRQFGSFGPHTRDDAGRVLVEYRWPDRSPLDTRQSELPLLTKAQFFAMVDAAEAVLRARGWTQVKRSEKGESDAHRVYDLTDAMQFDLDTGERVSLLELRELAGQREGLRCSASWLEGAAAVNTSRCIVGQTSSGHLTIWESAAGTTHMEASLKPRDHSVDMAEAGRKLQELKDAQRRNRITASDGAHTAAVKLLATHAYCAHPSPMIVPLLAKSLDAGLTPLAMRMRMLPNCDQEVGPRGGTTTINPFDLFMSSDQRIEVAGLRLRPDKEPLYEEDGVKWVNIYSPPAHDATGGSPAVGIAFLEHLLPDAGERRWFTQWLAHKVRYPFVPGPAVLMVARQFGTGRGTLGSLCAKLLGPEYVTTLPFHMFAGKSYQSQYDDWGAETLMAIITEASEAGEAGRWSAKQDTYTHIKSLVEPRATMRKYVSKRQHFKALSFTSYLIATNDVDALPIPAHDRRFAVLSNGDVAEPEFWIAVNAWMDDPANVAAFHGYLMAFDMTGYSPYEAPPKTEASTMAELGRSVIDRCLDEALAGLGDVFTLEQVTMAVERAAREDDALELPEGGRWKTVVRNEIAKRCYRVGVKDGSNWKVQIAPGKRLGVYAKTKKIADKWKLEDRLREEVLKNQPASFEEKLGTVTPFRRV